MKIKILDMYHLLYAFEILQEKKSHIYQPKRSVDFKIVTVCTDKNQSVIQLQIIMAAKYQNDIFLVHSFKTMMKCLLRFCRLFR
jgi:hypothetical protein